MFLIYFIMTYLLSRLTTRALNTLYAKSFFTLPKNENLSGQLHCLMFMGIYLTCEVHYYSDNTFTFSPF